MHWYGVSGGDRQHFNASWNQEDQVMLYLGIDQHSKQLTVSIRDESGNAILRRQVSTQWKKVRDFFSEVRERGVAQGGYQAVVEVCGFNHWLLKLLPEYGCRETIVVQPEEKSKHKTDRRDASQLSEVLWVNRDRLAQGLPARGLRRIQVPDAEGQADRRLTSLRHDVGRELTRAINRIKAVLRRHNLQQDCPTKGIQTKAATKWLWQLSLTPEERLEMDQQLTRVGLLREQLQRLQTEIAARYERSPAAQLLSTIPGAAAYSSLGLACRVGDVARFKHPRSLANYWGLTPGSRNSGEVTQRLGSITKQGSGLARFLLGQLVMHVLRDDPWMRGWFRGIKHRRGAKIARVAVMRRLATIIWHMLTSHEGYVCGGPPQARLKRKPAVAGN
jgi:transposase